MHFFRILNVKYFEIPFRFIQYKIVYSYHGDMSLLHIIVQLYCAIDCKFWVRVEPINSVQSLIYEQRDSVLVGSHPIIIRWAVYDEAGGGGRAHSSGSSLYFRERTHRGKYRLTFSAHTPVNSFTAEGWTTPNLLLTINTANGLSTFGHNISLRLCVVRSLR